MRVLALLATLVTLAAAACDQPRVGNPCHIEGDPASGETVLASPAPECEARQCLRVQGAADALCTAECDTDDDCPAMPDSPCSGPFVCEIPFVTGGAACRKMCLCIDDASRIPPSEGTCL
jgi:hypothetical protein